MVTYVTQGLERDYHHGIAFIVLHFLRMLYLAPFLMTLRERERKKRNLGMYKTILIRLYS